MECVWTCVVTTLGACVVTTLGACVVTTLGACVVTTLGACVVTTLGACVVTTLGACVTGVWVGIGVVRTVAKSGKAEGSLLIPDIKWFTHRLIISSLLLRSILISSELTGFLKSLSVKIILSGLLNLVNKDGFGCNCYQA